MAAAGEYDTPLEWLRRTPGDRDTFGQRAETDPSQGFLWCAVEGINGVPASGEVKQPTVAATIRARNYPAVVAGDQLQEAGRYLWTVSTVARGDNEVVMDATAPALPPGPF